MKKLILILALASIVGCGGQARAAEKGNALNVFNNQTSTTTIDTYVHQYNKVSVQVPPPVYGNLSSAYDISVSADGANNFVVLKTYSGITATASGITDVPATTAATHVRVTYRQKKHVHPYRKAATVINKK
jgi:hypothetical protein